jgi:uncharacterized damage-inducible protein DinB
MELLNGVTHEQASAKPIPGAHSIWELVLHIIAWEREALLVMQGKRYQTLAGEQDWPPVGATDNNAWQAALADLESVTRNLVAAIKPLAKEKLTEIVEGVEYDFDFLLHGIVQHNLYHAGQIAILKRAAKI